MPGIEIPRSWDDISALARKHAALPAQMEEIDILRTANNRAVFRELTGNMPPLLPGIVQTHEYVRGLSTELGGPYDRERTEAAAAMRLGTFSLLLESRTSLEFVVSEQALHHRPAGLCEADMYDVLSRTLEAARRPEVDLRVLTGAFDTQPRLSFSMFYTDGPAGDRGHGFVTGVGEFSSLPVRESGMYTLELAWAEARNQALDVQASYDCIEAALSDYRRAVTP